MVYGGINVRTNYLIVKGIRNPKVLHTTNIYDEAKAYISLYRNSKKSRGVDKVYIYRIYETHNL